MADQMVDVIFESRAAHLQFFDLLVGCEIDFFFDSVNGVVQPVILIEHRAEMVVGAFQAANNLTMFGKFMKNRMMKVHSLCVL